MPGDSISPVRAIHTWKDQVGLRKRDVLWLALGIAIAIVFAVAYGDPAFAFGLLLASTGGSIIGMTIRSESASIGVGLSMALTLIVAGLAAIVIW